MNILILGSGGREHAMAYAISRSPRLSKLFIAPGNAGTANLGTNIDVSPEDFDALKVAVLGNKINMVVVGPEVPLVKGVVDFFHADSDLKDVLIIGPNSREALLEGSKNIAKDFMLRYGIPTAKYKSFTKIDIEAGSVFLESFKPPYVLKADGLAAGKGVLILDDIEQARAELKNMIDGKFGSAGKTVVIEEFLKGIEVSVFAASDGESYLMLPEAKDYKRIGEGDSGLNTGGMGAVSPVPFADKSFMKKVEEKIVIPTIEGLKRDGLKYKGFIFFGIMNVDGEPYLIEYNVRMGDPETEVVLPRIKTDFVDLLEAIAHEQLDQLIMEIDERNACTVMLVSQGYPGDYEKEKVIKGLDKVDGSIVFHAGTKTLNGEVVTNGGRVMAVTSMAGNMTEALKISYKNIGKIDFQGKNFRTDIGFDL